MPDLGTYHFLPWLRRGIGAALVNSGATLPARAKLDVRLVVDATLNGAVTPVTPSPGASVCVYGPGDVIGIDPNIVIRTEPRAYTSNFEPNYGAGIEFDTPDFPWLFTPAAADGDRLLPWLALIALKNGEYVRPRNPPPPLASIPTTNIAAIPHLDE